VLQAPVVSRRCGSGKSTSQASAKSKIPYAYFRCTGSDAGIPRQEVLSPGILDLCCKRHDVSVPGIGRVLLPSGEIRLA
jgi:hypothetical protein